MIYKATTSNGDTYEARILEITPASMIYGPKFTLHRVTKPEGISSVSLPVNHGLKIDVIQEDTK